MSDAPKLYLTNLATVSRAKPGDPRVGEGPVLGILRCPPRWSKSMLSGHVRALMPTRSELFRAKAGSLSFDDYREALEARWASHDIRPERLTIAQRGKAPHGRRSWLWDDDWWFPDGKVQPGSTLVCVCATGSPCHRQVAAEMLAAAGWCAVLDGEQIIRADARAAS